MPAHLGEADDPQAAPFPLVPAARARSWDIVAVVSVGGGIGSVARYGLARAWPTPSGGVPWATFITNVSGCLILGLLMVGVLEVWPPARYRRPFLGIGVLGGFTTFSTYALEVRGMIAAHHWSVADAYALSSLVAGMTAVWVGVALARLAGRLPVRRGPQRRGDVGRKAVVRDKPPATGGGTP